MENLGMHTENLDQHNGLVVILMSTNVLPFHGSNIFQGQLQACSIHLVTGRSEESTYKRQRSRQATFVCEPLFCESPWAHCRLVVVNFGGIQRVVRAYSRGNASGNTSENQDKPATRIAINQPSMQMALQFENHVAGVYFLTYLSWIS